MPPTRPLHRHPFPRPPPECDPAPSPARRPSAPETPPTRASPHPGGDPRVGMSASVSAWPAADRPARPPIYWMASPSLFSA